MCDEDPGQQNPEEAIPQKKPDCADMIGEDLPYIPARRVWGRGLLFQLALLGLILGVFYALGILNGFLSN